MPHRVLPALTSRTQELLPQHIEVGLDSDVRDIPNRQLLELASRRAKQTPHGAVDHHDLRLAIGDDDWFRAVIDCSL